jgi:hypothetical protein
VELRVIERWRWGQLTVHYENSMLGGNEFGHVLPQVSDDAGTPFTVVLVPVAESLAVKAQPVK